MIAPAGAAIQVSEAALALQGVSVRVAQDATGAPALPQGIVPVGAIHQFGPVASFAAVSEIAVPFDLAAVPAGQEPRLYFTMPQSDGSLQWSAMAGATLDGGVLSAKVPVLGYAFVGVDPTLPGQAGGRESRQATTAASLSLGMAEGSTPAPLLPGSRSVYSVKSPTTLTLSAQYVLPQCARPPVLTVTGLHCPRAASCRSSWTWASTSSMPASARARSRCRMPWARPRTAPGPIRR